ncbi:tripartite tricarboxylate transporter substrate binding protein [Ramlibacter sp. AW1]|uniref:Tripartite tricarboxylate transporter substrate binding protein n=1 Tax=Ramlibacter aurantiacus TaxID=2801330 RepID=A0A936ZS89_9BURK|nr:tripartite tricarboxylate transporter substrate binding protein [Ramlibacter aurantiacus]MBL0422695.1 tripartite tricarboxylate transporter substrate binding protein [Ramlibacter aurantiacus]
MAHLPTTRGFGLTRRSLLLAASATALPFGAAQAQDTYPNRPIRLIIAFTPGSIGDLFMRHVTQQMPSLGQPIVIDNKPGASQVIGGELAARAPADGYTLFMGTQSGLVLNSIARKKLPYDPVRDFTPVTMLFAAPMYLYVNPAVQAKTVPELIALAKANPGKLTFASIGAGTSSHILGEMFKSMAGVDMLHVPFKGGPEATQAVASGQVDVFFNGANSMGQVRQGKLKVIASAGLKRTEERPDLPTVAEAGLEGFEVLPWFGLFGPAGMPRPIVERLNREFVTQLRSTVVKEKAAQMGIEVMPGTPEGLATQLKNEFPVMTQVMRKAGIEAE